MAKLKEVPDSAPLVAVCFMDGAEGFAEQQYRCNAYRVSVTHIREKTGQPFVTTIMHDELEESFGTLDELNAAIRKHNEIHD